MDPFFIFGLLILLLSVIVHEVAHSFVADMLGDPTARLEGRLTLNPLPHIDPVGSVLLPGILLLSGTPFLFGWAKPVPYNPYNLKRGGKWAEALVAGAGPGINLALVLFFGAGIRLLGHTISETTLALMGYVVLLNLIIAFFNLIPMPPLDGSKILKSLLPFRAALAFGRFEERLSGMGMFGLIGFLLFFVFFFREYFFRSATFAFQIITGLPLAGVL